jgi:hypothetical protein
MPLFFDPVPSSHRTTRAAAGRRGAALFALALLAGCASAPPTPVASTDLALPRWVRVTTHVPGQPDQDAMLAVQAEGAQATRWSLFDPLGMPQARQILQDGKWRNDGFLPPNGRASNLFSAILFAWTPAARLPSAYAGSDWHEDHGAGGGTTRVLEDVCSPRWTIAWAPGAPADTFSISEPGGTQWTVTPLRNTP